jgi:hypothetical protein
MLTGLTKAVRKWVAMGFIAIYAVCILAPTAALAFTAVSCLTEHSRSQPHSQAGDAAHQHDDQQNHPGPVDSHDEGSSKCCGMVFCSAVVPDLNLALAPDVPSGRTAFAAMQDFTGLPPYKLIRPPRSES